MILIQRRFSNVTVFDTDVCFTLEAGMGEGGGVTSRWWLAMAVIGVDLWNQTISGGGGNNTPISAIRSASSAVRDYH